MERINDVTNDLNEIQKSAWDLAMKEAWNEFSLRCDSETKCINANKAEVCLYIKKHQKEHEEMVRELYHQKLDDLKKMWIIKNNNKK